MLFNFTRFVTWPDGAIDEEIKICVIGTNPFDGALKSLQGKQTGSGKISVENVSTADRAADCHVLFVNLKDDKQLAELFATLNTQPVLTVSEQEAFAENGGMFQFKTVNKRLRFIVNIDAVKATGLQVSSKLLRLALKSGKQQ